DLSVQAANTGSLSDTAKTNIQEEIDQLAQGLDDIASQNQFKRTTLLDGSRNGTFQVGATERDAINIQIQSDLGHDDGAGQAGGVSAAGLGVDALTVPGTGDASHASAEAAIAAIDTAIEAVSDVRSDLGAKQNRLDHTINNLQVSLENL